MRSSLVLSMTPCNAAQSLCSVRANKPDARGGLQPRLIRNVRRHDHHRIQSIQRGIVFLMAEWSGGAKWAHGQLVAFLEQRGIPADQLHMLDVDRHPELYDLPEFTGKIHGWS